MGERIIGRAKSLLRTLGLGRRGEAYEALISLGGLCQVAYQVEKRFGFRIKSPFDWLVTPLGAIERVLTDDGAGFGQSVTMQFDGGTAVCDRYGVAHHHDFPRTADYKAMVSAEALEACRAKHLHKYRSFIDFMRKGRRTVFIRLGGHLESPAPHPYVADPKTVETEDLNRLCRTLEAKFPGLSFTLAFVYYEAFTPVAIDPAALDPRVRVFALPTHPQSDWMGDTGAWGAIFDQLRIAIPDRANTACQFGEETREMEVMHA